jgi:hypothetical protein
VHFIVKQKLLFAIYEEQQKNVPDMGRISAEMLQVDAVQFRVAADKLYNESMIEGAVIITEGSWPIPKMVFLDNVRLTEYGRHYVLENIKQAN